MHELSLEITEQEAYELGLACHQNHQLDKAEAYYRTVLRQNAAHAAAHNNLALVLISTRRIHEAEQHCRRAIECSPQFFDPYFNLAVVLSGLQKNAEAECMYRQALSLREGFPDALNNLSTLLREQGRFDEAEQLLRQALQSQPDYAQVHNNLALLLKDTGRFNEAEYSLREALRLKPDYVEAHNHLALLYLSQGNFRAGWPEYEYRLKLTLSGQQAHPFPYPKWRGEPLAGRRILLAAEQGLGDQIQFARYVSMLQRQGAQVDMVVMPELAELMRSLPGVNEVFALQKHGNQVNAVLTLHAPYDYWDFLLSVPQWLTLETADIPTEIPYLRADAQKVQSWRERLQHIAGDKKKIGVVWAGNAQYGNDRFRSMPFAELAHLFELESVQWFSLQKGVGEEHTHNHLYALTHDLHDFSDTAAVIENLDLVISVDTSVVHMAGALGKPVWVLLAQNADWRWLMERTDSPWYPSARLFRQAYFKDWRSVIAEVSAALVQHFSPAFSVAVDAAAEAEAAADSDDLYQLYQSALASHQAQRLDEAEAQYRSVLQQDNSHCGAHNNLALVLSATGRLAEAEQSLRRAIALKPDYADAHSNLALILQGQARLDEAELHLRDALTLAPDYSSAHNNLGNLLKDQGRLEEAERQFQQALQLQPEYISAHYNLSLLYLQQGRFREGWPKYEYRLRLPYKNLNPNPFPYPRWRGESLAGRRILLVAEQGYGDQIQFIRYAQVLQRQGAHVDVIAMPALRELISSTPGVTQVFSAPDTSAGSGARIDVVFTPTEPYHYWDYLLSVPQWLTATVESIPADVPYFSVNSDKVKHWHRRLQALAGHKKKIGLVWAGSAQHANDQFRSIPLSEFAPLLAMKRVKWFGLQKGRERAVGYMNLHELGRDLKDFVDTAAVIENLDLVITVDTSVAHLAGALGKPVWVLLPVNSDWRWLRERSDSPWYPSMRLFRQSVLGRWDEVLNEVMEQMEQMEQRAID